MKIYYFLIAAAFALSAIAQHAEAALYGATGGSSPSSLYVLDPTDGSVVSTVGPLQDAGGNAYAITGLAFRPSDGVLFGSTSNASPTGRSHLVTIDPNTALVVDVGEFGDVGFGDSTMSDITFDPTSGILYAWRAASGHGLYTIDTTTGAATLVGGQTDDFGGGALAASAGGTLYSTPDGVSGNPPGNFNTVSPADGSTLTSVPLTGSSPFLITAMDFDGLGTLYGAQGQGLNARLVTISTTGVITDVGPTVASLDAIAFTPSIAAVPEPASLALWGLGALGCAVAYRRRKRA